MSASSNSAAELAQLVKDAKDPLRIIGADSRASYGEPVNGMRLPIAGFDQLHAYEPTELYVRVGAGMKLGRLHELLAERGQEPAGELCGAPDATVGGAIAAGIDGPLRPGKGGLRDHLLGCRIIDGSGNELGFGGDLIKNVAGFDVSRLQAGALGTLGVLTEVSLRVAGKPQRSLTLARECSAQEAIEFVNETITRGIKIGASAWSDGLLRLRLAGASAEIEHSLDLIDGHELDDAEENLWRPLQELRWQKQAGDEAVWLCRIPPLTELPFDDQALIEWHGARRWFFDDAPSDLRETVAAAGGSAVLYRRGPGMEGVPVFPEPAPGVLELAKRIKSVFDPRGILNPGRRSYI